ncbi:MAG: hypothetical protein KAR20_06545 [Candidatus Heimdallarchaeota archaeon]|nr:hypothetical protein [Candidatus Heimdallarchaeota archaeon]
MKLANPEKQIYERMRAGLIVIPETIMEGMNAQTARTVEKKLKGMGISEPEGDTLFAMLAKSGAAKGISDFVKKHSKFKKYEVDLFLVAGAMGF